MKKIIDFKGIEKYFCIKCKHIHFKYRKGKKTTIFQKHQEFAYSMNTTEQFKMSFKRNWKNHGKRIKNNREFWYKNLNQINKRVD